MATVVRSVNCIDLTQRGLAEKSIDLSLVGLAIADAKRQGRSIELYKVVADASRNYYVFSMAGWSDIYSVYETDSRRSQFTEKYQYGSLHYPCSAADKTSNIDARDLVLRSSSPQSGLPSGAAEQR